MEQTSYQAQQQRVEDDMPHFSGNYAEMVAYANQLEENAKEQADLRHKPADDSVER
jgi:hypothetical protein